MLQGLIHRAKDLTYHAPLMVCPRGAAVYLAAQSATWCCETAQFPTFQYLTCTTVEPSMSWTRSAGCSLRYGASGRVWGLYRALGAYMIHPQTGMELPRNKHSVLAASLSSERPCLLAIWGSRCAGPSSMMGSEVLFLCLNEKPAEGGFCFFLSEPGRN